MCAMPKLKKGHGTCWLQEERIGLLNVEIRFTLVLAMQVPVTVVNDSDMLAVIYEVWLVHLVNQRMKNDDACLVYNSIQLHSGHVL